MPKAHMLVTIIFTLLSTSTNYANLTCKDKLNGSEDAVTVISPPSSTKSDNFFSRFGRVAASNCGGAWKYSCLVGVDKDGLLIWLNEH
jgi:hypothetical protein